MTNEERDIITRFIERVSGAQGISGMAVGGSTTLPPIDPEADQLIGSLMTRYPEARYRLTQTAYANEVALGQATQQIQQLQAALQQAQAQAQQAQRAAPSGGGFFASLFGGGARPAAPPPQPYTPQYPPAPAPYQQGYPQQPGFAGAPAGGQMGGLMGGGGGFLGSALTTAAGVAGGMVVGNALMNLFEGHHGAGASLGTADASPWAIPVAPAAAPADGGYVDQGSWTQDAGSADSIVPDNGGGGSDSWSDAGGGGGGGGDDSWS